MLSKELVLRAIKMVFHLIPKNLLLLWNKLGTPAGTSRGFGQAEFSLIANLICDVLDSLNEKSEISSKVELEVKDKIKNLCYQFPIY